MAAKKITETVMPEEVHNADTAKAKVYELIEAKVADMMRGPDRNNDPNIMRAIAELLNAMK